MSNNTMRSNILLQFKKYLIITIGTILVAASVNLIYEPLGLVTGGVSGLAIVIKEITKRWIDGGMPLWIFTVISNLVLFIVAAKIKGFKFLISSTFGTIVFVFALMLIPVYDIQTDDYLLASILGGVLGGAGIGLVFMMHASTGGTDLLASVIQASKKHISIPQILYFIDGAIILLGATVFGLDNALYAIIAVFITAKVSDGILEGLKFAKMAYIISEHNQEIADTILNQIGRGVTGLNVRGMYSNNDKNMIFCVVSKKEIIQIIDIAKKIDPKSFVIISDVREVVGEGFIEYRQ